MNQGVDPSRPGPQLRVRLQQLLDSYAHHLGTALADHVDDLYALSTAVLAHDTQTPPILWYGNRRALELWKLSFDEFVCMPSYRTAEPDRRATRKQLLAEVRTRGVAIGYTGVRIASDGTRFRIENVAIWNILDDGGSVVGQAAACPRVVPL